MFRAKNRKPDEQSKKNIIEVSDKDILLQLENLINQIGSVSGKKKAELLNKIGDLYFKLNRIDDAISYYEASIEENKTLGRAYTELIKLYNIKQKEAIKKNDDANIKFYMEKIDDLLQLSKDVIRGKL